MNKQKLIYFFVFLLLALLPMDILAQQHKLNNSTRSAIQRLEKDIPGLMKLSDVPGMSVVLIRDGKLVWHKGFGVLNSRTQQPVTDQSVFEAYSLSKPMFAYAVLTLVDQGKLDLDKPLNDYLGDHRVITQDQRIRVVTARMVLSHTSGIKEFNQGKGDTVSVVFDADPGKQFKYSAPAFDFLSRVIIRITGYSLADFMRKAVLDPLGMSESSYIWLPRYENRRAYQHDEIGVVDNNRLKWEEGYACCSLETTPAEYAKFVIAAMDGKLLTVKSWQEMMKPQVQMDPKFPGISWGLGWGLEKTAGDQFFWHWGDGGHGRAYIAASLKRKNAILFFANGANGLSFAKEIVADAFNEPVSQLTNLDVERLYILRYNSPPRKLLQQIRLKGAATALTAYQKGQQNPAGITEAQFDKMAWLLLETKRTADALAIYQLNTKLYPGSWIVYDSYGYALKETGKKPAAVAMFQKSLDLKPGNDNAKKMLQELAK